MKNELQTFTHASAFNRFVAGSIPFNALRAYIEMLILRNYSENTIQNYVGSFVQFLIYFKDRRPSELSKAEIMDYLADKKKTQNWSSTLQNQHINAIKFFFEKLLNKPKEVYALPRAKREFRLPNVFAEDEVRRMILLTNNLKHRAVLCLAYAAGLRVSEVCNLKLSEIDSARMVIHIRQSKGKKDRQVMLSETLLILLREYFKKYKPAHYLFEGQNKEQYNVRSIQQVIHYAKERAGVKRGGSVHAIRHSFATHLLEGGTDLFTIKELLGHASISTTTIYTHLSRTQMNKIQSPLDKLGL